MSGRSIRRRMLGRNQLGKDISQVAAALHHITPPSGVADHGGLVGLDDDDHPQYFVLTQDEIVTGQPTFQPSVPQAPFLLSANAQGRLVTGLRADQLNKDVIAGAGLITGGTLTSDVTIDVGDGVGLVVNANDVALGTPSTLAVDTTDNVTATSHTHKITSSEGASPGGAIILSTDGSGYVWVDRLGIGVSPSYPLHVQAGVVEQFRLAYDATYFASFKVASAGNLTIATYADIYVDPNSANPTVFPNAGYEVNLGSLSKKYLTLHCAELWVETLVAQDTIATIGGRILVGPTTMLEEDLGTGDDYFLTKHSQTGRSDIVYMEANGKVEFMLIDGWDIYYRTPNSIVIAGDYTALFVVGTFFRVMESTNNDQWFEVSSVSHSSGYTTIGTVETVGTGVDGYILRAGCGGPTTAPYGFRIIRNLDGSGANPWNAGDAVFNTGWEKDGFMDLYSYSGIVSSTVGPTIVGNVRNTNANTILNPGFETVGAGPPVFLNWNEQVGDGVILQDSGAAHTGTYSAKLTAGPTANTHVRQSVTVTGGKWYQIRLWATGDGSGNHGEIGVYDNTNDIWPIPNSTDIGLNANYWARRYFYFKTASNTTQVTLYLQCPSVNTNWVRFDDIVLRKWHFNDWSEHWAIGNLNGVYGKSSNDYGLGFGRYHADGGYNYLTITDTNGIEFFDDSGVRSAQLTGTEWTIGATSLGDYVKIYADGIEMFSDDVKVIDIDSSGNVTLGQVTDSQGNVHWNYSNKRLEFRGGTAGIVVEAYIDTDGSFVAGDGVVTLNTDGIKIESSGEWVDDRSYRFVNSSDESIGNIQVSEGGNTSGRFVVGGSSMAAGRGAYAGVTSLAGTAGISQASLSADQLGSTDLSSIAVGVKTDGDSYARIFGIEDSGEFLGLVINSAPSGYPSYMLHVIGDGYFSTDLTIEDRLWIGNETVNTKLTLGLTINQGSAGDEILAFKAASIDHGMFVQHEIDTYGAFKQWSQGSGGLKIVGLSDDSQIRGLSLHGAVEVDSTTKSTTGVGVVNISAHKKSGTDFGALSADGNILSIQNNTTTMAIFSQDGDIHMASGKGVVSWDEYDDVALLTGLRASLRRMESEFIEYARPILEATGVVTYNDDGIHFVGMKGLQMLTIDTMLKELSKIDHRLTRLEQALLEGGTS